MYPSKASLEVPQIWVQWVLAHVFKFCNKIIHVALDGNNIFIFCPFFSLHPNLRYLKAGLRPVHVSFTLSSVWWRKIPKLFSYEKLFVRVGNYQNAKRAHCTKSESTKVPKVCTDIRLLSVTVWAKRNFENIVLIQSYMYEFEKVCLGLIAPKFEVPQADLRPVHVSFTLSSVWWRKISTIIFLRKVIRPFRKISKCKTGSLYEKWKY